MFCMHANTVYTQLSSLLQCFLKIMYDWILFNLCCFMPKHMTTDYSIIYSGKWFSSVSLEFLVKMQILQVKSIL